MPEYQWGDIVGQRPDMYFECDDCGATEHGGTRIYQGDEDYTYCRHCWYKRHEVNDIIRAFYPEMAEFINQDPSLAATNRTLLLDLDLQGVVAIQKDPATWGNAVKQVEMISFYGIMDNDEVIKFVARCGKVDLQLSHNIVGFKPHSVVWDNSQTHSFYYNVFDNTGFDFVFDWARQKTHDWVHKVYTSGG